MKLLIVFALVLATGSAELRQRNVVVPVLKKEGRILDGKNAAVGQFPYQVGLTLKINALSSSWCGGSLIGKNWVLTAAHCTDGVQSVIVHLGATVRTAAEVSYNVPASDIIIHSGWSFSTLKNDISLVKIPSVSYSANIQPIQLPAIASSYSTYAGDTAITAGWGVFSSSASLANTLQWGYMKVITNTACAASFGSTVTSTNICVSTADGSSTCTGDSGGALVLESPKVQIGLVSFGSSSGCVLGYPTVYTRVTSYLDWIKDHTGISY